MSTKRARLFGSTKVLERQIDEFLDKVSEGGMVLERGADAYFADDFRQCEEMYEKISHLEGQGDQLRREIELSLYTEMLIPESRGDVLNLLGDLDGLLDGMKTELSSLVVERPEIPPEYNSDLRQLVSVVVGSIESTVVAARAFFRDTPAVRDHVHKIGFYETEGDRIEVRLKRNVFGSDLPLQRKLHLLRGIELIGRLADAAEDCGDRLSIYAVKRSL